MDFIEYIILGIIQGITEFLPFSSSGHYLIGRFIFGMDSHISGSFIEIFLHGGTLLSILLYWKKELIEDTKKIINGKSSIFINIIIGTLPAAVIGLLFKDQIDDYLFNIEKINYLAISYFFLSVILFLTKSNTLNRYDNVSYKYAFIIGLAQCFAIIPGISRAGITIATALYIGINHKDATKFSFILAIPILFFSFLVSIIENYIVLTIY